MLETPEQAVIRLGHALADAEMKSDNIVLSGESIPSWSPRDIQELKRKLADAQKKVAAAKPTIVKPVKPDTMTKPARSANTPPPPETTGNL